MPRLSPVVPVLALSLLLSGCDMLGDLLGIQSPAAIAAAREADGRAIGAACRQAARALEDCYAMNSRAERAAMFAGWREMNDYMRENDMRPVVPQLAAGAAPAPAAAASAAADTLAQRRPGPGADAAKAAKPQAS